MLCLACVNPLFAAHKRPSKWDGSSANFGLNVNTGDTKTKELNMGSILQFTARKWSENLNLNYQLAYTDNTQTKGIFNGTDNVNYYFSEDKKTFVAGNINVISDVTSTYRYTVVGSTMYGRTLHNTKRFTWDIQVGPGMRYNAPHVGYESYTRPVAVFLSNFTLGLKNWGALTENLRYELGRPYNYFQTTTNITNKLYGHLALQLSFQLNHYSELTQHVKASALTNTTTTASIVYNF
jgi:putative salt-induced outer membrane protein